MGGEVGAGVSSSATGGLDMVGASAGGAGSDEGGAGGFPKGSRRGVSAGMTGSSSKWHRGDASSLISSTENEGAAAGCGGGGSSLGGDGGAPSAAGRG